jgi:beta-aspartyl-peptidase (threonine type)
MANPSLRYGIVVHGGAGTRKSFGTDRIDAIKLKLIEAAEIGKKALESGIASAVDAVETVVTSMEDSGVFNAGRSSSLNAKKAIQMDAGIMDGRSLNCGAVGAIEEIPNPLRVARKVMELTPHVLIVGRAATEFAILNGFHRQTMEVGEEKLRRFNEELSASEFARQQELSTVGAVAIDENGNLASAVSTGGLWLKMDGRVGDSAVVGAGFYADNNAGAAVATGNGDAIMKICLCKEICDQLSNGIGVREACKMVITRLGKVQNGRGGVIALDKEGNLGIDFNTDGMAWCYLLDSMREPRLGIFEKQY